MEALGDRALRFVHGMVAVLCGSVVELVEHDVPLDDVNEHDRDAGQWELVFAVMTCLLKVLTLQLPVDVGK